MPQRTTIDFDDEMEAALAELVATDGTKKNAIKKALVSEAKRRRVSRATLTWISAWEETDGPIDQEHLDWADTVLDRQGVPK